MRPIALVSILLLAAFAPEAAPAAVPAPKDLHLHAKVAGAPRPGWPYFQHPVCRLYAYGFFGRHHVVAASGVRDIPQTCSQLWANLREFDGCRLLTKAHCGGTDGYLQWRFQGWVSCNLGMVSSAWFDATGQALGILDCAGKQPDVQPEDEED
ncbi:hypothetical protein CH63R_12541 [Colletotrichum higginsianum IMI 349063]|uniref:Uncharacterized protein n=2 Tax=Colletotrichum higginsianum TaxID=80884 RepID=A0A1B7XUK0_COLHI|nr:hypothetical protein CH63R_12541 [Colletotrichum higginsianum IMI 349063]OBR03414.1 hypothetical protein CH63R_12541 [Colletotrichum higginsianum IMI 349063]TIC89963.1 hypothetical protein CH35J_012502 [Colletotrichum higginsianum]